MAIFAAIEEHHGAYSHEPPLSEVEVSGVQLSPDVRAELSAYGFSDLSRSQSGFTAHRHT